MKKIMFVCHGNICRSPMAEFVMKSLAAEKGAELHIESSATSREEIGNGIYPPAAYTLSLHGIDSDGHRARRITRADVDGYDYIYYMDASNLRYLQRMFPGETKFRAFLDRNVADPWYTGDFTQTWLDITEGCSRIMEELA